MPLNLADNFWNSPQRHRPLHLNDKRYLIKYSSDDENFQAHQSPSFVTTFTTEAEKPITEKWFAQRIEEYQREDDVFDIAFLQGVILLGQSQIRPDAKTFLESAGMQWSHSTEAPMGQTKLQEGPYALLNGYLRKIYRAYGDSNSAFFCAVDSDGESYRTQCLVESIEGGSMTVAVPSRVQYRPSTTLPLAGLRVAVKDNFDLKGTRTSLTSRSFYETFPVKQRTAPCIQRLVELGALLIGKTKLTSLATWEEPNESTDFMAPWSPRADGYLSAGGSSNGSAAAVSSYAWLDIAIGSDTTGSVMRPALWNGCFAMRPSHGYLSTDGFFSCIEYLDTPAFLGRDLQLAKNFATAWYGAQLPPELEQRPFSAIVWPTDYWKTIDIDQCDLALSFTNDLEISLGLKHQRMSFKEKWNLEPPPEANGQSLDAFMLKATEDMWYDDYHAFDEFRTEYHRKFHKVPYVSPPTLKAWADSKRITEDERTEAVQRLGIYRQWFRTVVLRAECEHALLVLPIENVYARYRDDNHIFQRPPNGVHNLLLASLFKSPELVVPIGHIPYFSKITEREEQLPFVIGLMSPPGSDMQLFDTTLACLKEAGRPRVVQTGATMFPISQMKGSL